MDLITALTQDLVRKDYPEFRIGDTIRLFLKVKEGNRERLQAFEGVVIARKHGDVSETITVRRVSYGVGVEKVFPINSPVIDHIEIVRHGQVRRAKLYYLRNKVGKNSKVKERIVEKNI